ncbi:MAG: DUF4382 domain-containing protein, partial [Myxococcales bacterium]|nr:DUF4382 domain-containing protein [Myxococcales bacterium]
MGRLRVLLHDAPTTAVDEVWVAWDEVRVHAVEDDAWLTVSDVPSSVDLLTLQGGPVTDLGLGSVPVGAYDEVRFVLTDAWVVVDGVREPLEVPSGTTSGLKLKVDIEVHDCGDTTVLVDWEVGAHLTENPHGYRLSPVLHGSSTYDATSCDACAGEVVFPDPVVDAYVRGRIGLPTGPITAADLMVPAMSSLHLERMGVTDLTGLECAGGTPTYLDLSGNPGLTAIDAVAGLTGLTALVLNDTSVGDLGPVADHMLLRDLRFERIPVDDLSALATLPTVITLGAAQVPALDWTPLRGMASLTNLNVRQTSLDRSDIFHPDAPLTYLYAGQAGFSDLVGLPTGHL